jgi:hypothetical protein
MPHPWSAVDRRLPRAGWFSATRIDLRTTTPFAIKTDLHRLVPGRKS